MSGVTVELTTESLEPASLDREALDKAMKLMAAAIDAENQQRMERFLMMQPPFAQKLRPCDFPSLLYYCPTIA